MVKEKLKDSFYKIKMLFYKNNINLNEYFSNKTYLYIILSFIPIIFFMLKIKTFFYFIILNCVFILSYCLIPKIENNIKQYLALVYIYILLPNILMIYIYNKNFKNIFIWLFSFVVISKISKFVIKNIFADFSENIKINYIFNFLILSAVSVVIGLISSLFMKQNIRYFTIISLLSFCTICLQDFIFIKIEEKLNFQINSNNFFDCFLKFFNNISLVSILIYIATMFNFVTIC